MMMALTDDAGKFRSGGVGVFMLQEILNTLKEHQGTPIIQTKESEVRDKVRDKFGISSV